MCTIIVIHIGVGKTGLVQKLANPAKMLNEAEPPTIGYETYTYTGYISICKPFLPLVFTPYIKICTILYCIYLHHINITVLIFDFERWKLMESIANFYFGIFPLSKTNLNRILYT